MKAGFRDYYELCKPRVVALMLITALVAMLLATPSGSPLPLTMMLISCIGIGLTAFAGGVVNHLIDRHIDTKMQRTENRPVAAGRVKPRHAAYLAFLLALFGVGILCYWVNPLTALLSFLTLIGYAVIYTRFLKHSTPQNIVIGGLAGAMPPLLGWVAITGHVSATPLLLVMIIFVWTPPHFWALAIRRIEDYKKADIPMLPVIYGIPYTKLFILLYTILLALVTYLPFIIDSAGLIYLVGVSVLNIGFLYYATQLYRSTDDASQNTIAWSTFKFSIYYLLILFIVLLIDHYLPILT